MTEKEVSERTAWRLSPQQGKQKKVYRAARSGASAGLGGGSSAGTGGGASVGVDSGASGGTGGGASAELGGAGGGSSGENIGGSSAENIGGSSAESVGGSSGETARWARFRLPWRGASRDDDAASATASAPTATVRGVCTGVPLSDVAPLLQPSAEDAFGALRPAFSETALKLALELSAVSYTLSMDDWLRAGWTDVSMQVDTLLESGVNRPDEGEPMQPLVNAWKLYRARASLRRKNPISQLRGALRQREKSDTIKAVAMLHRADAGRYVVAIGFMGTGARLYDWFSNMRFITEDGFHKGFLQLTLSFEENLPRMRFPDTARELGLDDLTLSDIVAEAKSPSSRFSLFLAGHSQGGAVMQIFTCRLLREYGVLPQNVAGYGFASPTVAVRSLSGDPAAYPLYHVLNADDFVPCMGGLMHLGMGLYYRGGDAFRAACYPRSADANVQAAREALQPFLARMRDTPSIVLTGSALLKALLDVAQEDFLDALRERSGLWSALSRMTLAAENRMDTLLALLLRRAWAGYAAVAGREIDQEEIAREYAAICDAIRALPGKASLTALKEAMLPPHRLVSRRNAGQGAYAYITRHGVGALRPFVWENPADGMPRRKYAEIGAGLRGAACAAGVFDETAGLGGAAVLDGAAGTGAGASGKPRGGQRPAARRVVSSKRAAYSDARLPRGRRGMPSG